MDSEDSRPGSSASSSSSTSSNNSRNSSAQPSNENGDGPQSPPASPQASIGRKSRSRSRSSNKSVERRSRSKSGSASSGSASSSDNEDNEDAISQAKSKRSSSEEGSIHDQQRPSSRPQSPSPVDSQRSSRHSSSSSNRSNSRAEPDNHEADVNISHEDLSDVSDMESEKRPSVNNSKQSMDDDGLNAESEKAPITSETDTNDIPAESENNGEPISELNHTLDPKKTNNFSENGRDGSPPNGGYSSPENENSNSIGKPINDLEKANDEDALDFEAEEGECPEETSKEGEEEGTAKNIESDKNDKENKSEGEAEEGEDLEEGEVSDEDEKRPEETEPKPVCRFYTRGQCTWGMSCRFLHPGVSDKGNYTMFDLVRPIPVSHTGTANARPSAFPADYHDFRSDRPPLHHRPPAHFAAPSLYNTHHDARALIPETPVVVESAWERGLRTAKEMMRKASKRKEQDMDFEDKKMNLPVSQEEMEKDAYFLKERASPEITPAFGRHGGGVYHEMPGSVYSPPDRFGRGPPMPPYEDIDPYGRSARYRELPPHRMPQYEDERRVRPTREVIVQRVEPVGRGDEWNDPWMRSKSPGARGGSREREDRRRRDRRSYSSNSSYSSSSSSQSDSSSDSSRSPSPTEHRRRYNSSQKSPMPNRRRSPSPLARRGRRSPAAISDLKTELREPRFNAFKDNSLTLNRGMRRSPIQPKRRNPYSRSVSLDKRLPYSPAHKRRKISPVTKKSHERSRPIRHRNSSSSGSDSSDSSGSDSDSDSGSSSSDSSSLSRGKSSRHLGRGVSGKAALDKKTTRKDPPKKRSPISIEIKKPATVGASALASPTRSPSSDKETKKSRREELLKQLRAVEEAIAKKRQKLA